jgi:hypothetical protein
MQVLELLGLADTDSDLTISLPAAAGEELAVTMHATTLVVAPPDAPMETEVAESDWSDLPSLADVAADGLDIDTGTLITRLWEATEEQESLAPPDDWSPEDFSEVAASDRTFRWPVVLGALAVAAGIAVAAWVISNLPERGLEDAKADYQVSSAELRKAVTVAAVSAGAITDPDASPDELAEAAAVLADHDAAGRKEPDLAATAPPSNGLLGVSDPTIEPIRANLRTVSERAIALERRLGEILTYRLLFDRAFRFPTLPAGTSPGNIPAIGVELSLVIADTADAIGQLPADDLFGDHRAAAEELVAGLDGWQVSYLAALRNRDLNEAARLIDGLESEVVSLRESLTEPLDGASDWTSQELAYIGAALDRIDDLLTDSSLSD